MQDAYRFKENEKHILTDWEEFISCNINFVFNNFHTWVDCLFDTQVTEKRKKKYDGKEWLWASRLSDIFHLKPNLINLHDSIIIFAIVNDSQNCRLWRHTDGIASHRIGCFHCAWMLFNRWNALLFIENYGWFRKLNGTH